MNNFMNRVKMPQIGRNFHDLSHNVKLSMKFGYLYPTMAMEVLPGQTVNIKCEHITRFMPLQTPTMHKFWHTTHYYFVPNRLCWSNWEKFITHREDGSQPAHPYINVGGLILGEPFYPPLCDYMGVPKPPGSPVDISLQVDAIPFMAYQKIWYEFYRDQNNIDATDPNNNVDATLADGNNSTLQCLYPLRKRAWEHDYFTSCLPEPQAGPAIELPLDFSDQIVFVNNTPGGIPTEVEGDPLTVSFDSKPSDVAPDGFAFIDGNDLGNANLATIESLRRSSAVQRFMERLIRGGKRYAEVIRSFFGVKAQDARLQRPEYITGVKSPVVISEVLNTTGTEELPQGNMAGHGISVQGGGYGERYTAQEHGWIIAVTSLMPETGYENGLPRSLANKTYFDYFWPEFADLGEDAVKNSEIFAYQDDRNETFGYLPMYSRYRTMFNRVCGQFRQGESLDNWHFGRQFTTAPALNQQFIECTPGKRIFAVTDEQDDEIVSYIFHNIGTVSPVPKFGTPTLH